MNEWMDVGVGEGVVSCELIDGLMGCKPFGQLDGELFG